MRTLGLLIAGGQGRRLGMGVPKALVEVAGVILVERAMAILAACTDDVRVVAPYEITMRISMPVKIVPDPPGDQGPLAALVEALGVETYERAIVLGVDYPLARPRFLSALADRLRLDVDAVVPTSRGMLQPLVAAYAPTARDVLADRLAKGERSVVAAVRTLRLRNVSDSEIARLEGGQENFMNVNTPEDLAAAGRRLARRP